MATKTVSEITVNNIRIGGKAPKSIWKGSTEVKEVKKGSTTVYKMLQTNALFLSSREQRISVKTVQWMVYKYLDMAGLESKHYSVHKLRHTAATLMYQSGNVDVRVLKDILGHEQLNTTQIYTHVSNESMEQAMQENPLAKVKRDKK